MCFLLGSLLDCHHTGFFGGLRGFAGGCFDGSLVLLAAIRGLGIFQLLIGLDDDRGGVLVGGGNVCDADGVARFKQFAGRVGIDSEDGVLNVRIDRGVGARPQQFVLGGDFLATGAFDEYVLQHDGVAGLRHGRIRFGGHDHAERLHVGVGLQVAFAVIERELTEIDSPALGRNRPEHIGQIFKTELGGIFQALELCVDLNVGFLAFNLGFSDGTRHRLSSLERDLHGAARRAIMHRLGGANYVGRFRGRLRLRRRNHRRGIDKDG